MKSLLFLLGGLIALSRMSLAEMPIPPELENEQILEINKEPWHATLMPYANLAEALAAKRKDSSFARSLNGTWKFHWAPRPEERPADFYKPGYDVSRWGNLPVPSNWQVMGYGTPIYRNHGYTIKADWPHLMSEPPKNYTAYKDRDPVGSYVRKFEMPAAWTGRRIHLSFDGVDAASFVWVNGKAVGYSNNSRNVAEFDITPYVHIGTDNVLAVEVYQYSSGSYLEDQDMWRLSGIFRNVTLWSTPQLHVRDFAIVTDLDARYRNAKLEITAQVLNTGPALRGAGRLDVTLYDREGKPVPGVAGQAAVPPLGHNEEAAVKLSLPVSDPAKWTAETPNLYTAVFDLKTGPQTVELLSSRVGFRKVEIKGRVFMVNGVPVKLKGANRHENWPDTGHYVSEGRMIEDIKLLKQANCNHVRTSHYSDDPRWYELCDEYGIYLVAEANLECHGLWFVLPNEPRLEKMWVDRNVANVESLKNHPSVIIWSLGNEAGTGPNPKAALQAVKKLDPTRPIHYQGFGTGKENPSDIDSRMYPPVTALETIAKDSSFTKPYYLCEYAHSMFNSMGSLGEYNDLFDKYPSLMGGAIWEWNDQGLWNRRDPKRQYLAYGGGFGDAPTDGYFIQKGVVFSDRSPKPQFAEVKRVYQWIGFASDDLANGRVRIKNKYAFTNLRQFTGTWSITEDGTRIQGGVLPPLDLGPGQEKVLTLPLEKITPKPGARYFLDIAVTLPRDEPWAKAGYEIANAQFPLEIDAPPARVASAGMKPLQLSEAGGTVTVKGSDFTVGFDRSTGTLSSLERDGVNVLRPGGGPRLHLWRARHQKDDVYAAKEWDHVGLAHLESKVTSFEARRIDPSAVRVAATTEYTGRNKFSVTHEAAYTVYGDGSIAVDNAVTPHGATIYLARYGVRLLLDKRLDELEYFARGPMENYADRKRGSDMGVYSSTVAAQLTPYAKPMECGNHEDTLWVALGGAHMPGLLAQAEESALQFSTLPYTDEELEKAAYPVDLPAGSQTVLCLSAKTLGVGSKSCGPIPLPQYLVDSSTPTAFTYVLRLLPPGTKDIPMIGQTLPPSDRVKPKPGVFNSVAMQTRHKPQ